MTIAVDLGRKATKQNKQTETKLFHFHWIFQKNESAKRTATLSRNPGHNKLYLLLDIKALHQLWFRRGKSWRIFHLFVFILYVPVNKFSLRIGTGLPGLNKC